MRDNYLNMDLIKEGEDLRTWRCLVCYELSSSAFLVDGKWYGYCKKHQEEVREQFKAT